MEEIARQGKVIVNWNGKNVTDDIAPYVQVVNYSDREEDLSDDISLVLDNTAGNWSNDWYPTEGDTIELLIGYQDKLINCGLFEVDEISMMGPPDLVEVRAIAAGITKKLRTRNSKAFEEQTLRQIAQYFCTKHGLTLVDDTGNMLIQINLERKTQEDETDLQFLSKLAKEYGFIFSIKGTNLVFTSYYNLDNAPAIMDISVDQIGSYSLTSKTHDTFKSGSISSRNANVSHVISYSEDYEGGVIKDDVLLVNGKASNQQQAEAKVKAALYNKNKLKQTGSLSGLDGNPELVAGINFNLIGLGMGSGKYHIVSSSHNLTGNGAYITSLEIRKTGDVPKPQRIPKKQQEEPTYDSNEYDAEKE